ncbi:metallophosphoesterase [Methylomarinum sp. Ch1-1]|uniref:Metallophosphoesterase n=1 Tax=Methylomarinum roseum TaxID=3067653 RepID=A0AAU7NYT3_9GAMM|nr:metallophosphoesterase [Methylomarinum sp. Ch1-1]MDP4521822.1 metallophosphoesterase [Methylomarinum sp. Ch1-1]
MTNECRILFAGDPHGDFAPLIRAVLTQKPEAVVLLGDYDLEKPLQDYLRPIVDVTEIWWIAGNHEFEHPDKHRYLFDSSLADNGLHLQVKDVAGLRIAGLGGIFLGRVWYPPNRPRWKSKSHFLSQQPSHVRTAGLSLKYQAAIWHDEVQRLKQLDADILVSHEAPRSHRHGFIVIDELAAALKVSKVFHGHLHEHYTATIRAGIKVHGIADRMVADLNGHPV